MKGISLIALVITILIILILARILIGTGVRETECINGYYEHKYIQISNYDNVNHQYYMTAVCERCGKELKAQKDY